MFFSHWKFGTFVIVTKGKKEILSIVYRTKVISNSLKAFSDICVAQHNNVVRHGLRYTGKFVFKSKKKLEANRSLGITF